MSLIKWELIPDFMKKEEVKEYYDFLKKKRFDLFFKRIFDIIFSFFGLILLLPFMIVFSIIIKLSSSGPVFYIQTRVTQYGRHFKIIKFRTMYVQSNNNLFITSSNDSRITKIGVFLRKYRIDEFPQLINILLGDMSFVGTRPEVEKYIKYYTKEMNATLLLPAGLTSLASIKYKNESKLLGQSDNPEKTYVEIILPQKMNLNLISIKNFSFFYDLKILINTFFNIIFKNNN